MSFLSLRGANISSSLKFSFLAAPFLYHFPQRKEFNRVYTRENKRAKGERHPHPVGRQVASIDNTVCGDAAFKIGKQ